ncbi:MAG: DUF2179 domain-containing protein [Planctomycetales bacterium]|nr:DUF2179 domain-containing protein [Planctomycetales bacterium]
MGGIAALPVWAVALLIFLVRIIDVSIGTLRTISVVQGRLALSVALGFFEVLVWIAALSQVITGVGESPFLMVAYAAGFATGNAVGITIDRKLALGHVVVRMITGQDAGTLGATLRHAGFRVTTFAGTGRDGPVTLVYVTVGRRSVAKLLSLAQEAEPQLFYTVEPVQQQSERLADALPHPTGWRTAFKKK